MTAQLTDLTMPLREGIAAYPSHGRSVLELTPVMRHADFVGKGRVNGYDGSPVSFEVSQWLIGDQAGTHMDAPWHADSASTCTIDRVPLDLAYGSAAWIDCSDVANKHGISIPMLQEGLARADTSLVPGDILLIRTGASDTAVTDPVAYARQATGLTKPAAEWLRSAGVKTVGIDCVTVECYESAPTADVHTVFLRPASLGYRSDEVIGIIENLVGIQHIPSHRFTFCGFPLPLVGAAGSPLRAVAIT